MPTFWDSSIRFDLLMSETIGELRMADDKKPTSNLLRLAGILNAANREADDEAGALIERVRGNQRRTLGLIAKGHQNESLREQMLSEAEKEQVLADLAAAVGDNGAPLDDEEDTEKVRADLAAAKLPKSSERSPVVEQTATFSGQGTIADTGQAAQGKL